MGCNRVRRTVFLWIDRGREELPYEPIERHLDECPECRNRALEVERVLLMVRSRCRRSSVPAGLADRIRGLLERL